MACFRSVKEAQQALFAATPPLHAQACSCALPSALVSTQVRLQDAGTITCASLTVAVCARRVRRACAASCARAAVPLVAAGCAWQQHGARHVLLWRLVTHSSGLCAGSKPCTTMQVWHR